MKLVRYADELHGHGQWSARRCRRTVGRGRPGSRSDGFLRLSVEKTKVVHIHEGFDFLGWHIQRRPWQGRTGKRAVWTPIRRRRRWPPSSARCEGGPVEPNIERWQTCCTCSIRYCGAGATISGTACHRTLSYLDHYAFWRIVEWLKKRHLGLNMHTLVRRFIPNWEIRAGKIEMFRPQALPIERYRYRGAKIPTPWDSPIGTIPPELAHLLSA